MKFIEIGNGVKLSEIALGAGSLGSSANEELCFSIMDKYIEYGGTTFDTARIYSSGNCDIALGKWMKSRNMKGKITIVTKGSHPNFPTMFVSRLSRREIEDDLDTSLKAIGLECSPLHILHRDDIKIPVEEIVDSLDAVVKAGKALNVGVSNWTASRIARANAYAKANGKSPISCSQAHYSLGLTTPQSTGDITHVPIGDIEASWYRESLLPLMAFGPQARGWFASYAAGKEPKHGPKQYYDGFPENHRRLERLIKLSKDMGCSVSTLTTAYARDSGLNAVPLCAFSSIAQLDDSFGALKIKLTRGQVNYLENGEY